jgi:hypothetical protein
MKSFLAANPFADSTKDDRVKQTFGAKESICGCGGTKNQTSISEKEHIRYI